MNPETGIEEAKRLATKKDRYTFIRQLGRGAFGTVFLAKDRTSGCEVAIKIIKARASLGEFVLGKKPSQVKEGRQEANLLFELRHNNILQIVETYEFKHFLTRGLAIVTEYCSQGSLQQCLKELTGPPDVEKRLDWYEQLATGLAFIHMKEIVHRDLKPANILVDSSNTLKIADVGLAKAIWDMQGFSVESNATFELYMSSVAGTPVYMAPEVWEGHYGVKCDIFSLGLVFVIIAERPNPLIPIAQWSNRDYGLGKLLSTVVTQRGKRGTSLLQVSSNTARSDEKHLFDKMLRYHPHSRPSMSEVRQEVRMIKKTYQEEQLQPRRPSLIPWQPRAGEQLAKGIFGGMRARDKGVICIAILISLTAICYGLYQYDLLVPAVAGLLATLTNAAIIGFLGFILSLVFLIQFVNRKRSLIDTARDSLNQTST